MFFAKIVNDNDENDFYQSERKTLEDAIAWQDEIYVWLVEKQKKQVTKLPIKLVNEEKYPSNDEIVNALILKELGDTSKINEVKTLITRIRNKE